MKYSSPISKTQYSSTVDQAESSSSGDTTKLKLFGFEFDPNPPAGPTHNLNHPNQTHPPAAEADESVSSSSTVNRTTPSGSNTLRCEYCMKEFGNSQALGGHQNAHKKERMKKKRLQLQARRATISSFYLHAPPDPTATRWFYDPAAAASSSCDDDVINYYCSNDEFAVYEETAAPLKESGRQISFNDHRDYFSSYDDVDHDHQDGFTLTTHHRPGGGRRLGKAAAGGPTGRADLDLQLGLRLR